MAKLPQQEIARVKALGFLRNRGQDTFSARVVSKNGVMTAEQLKHVAECAEKYGAGRTCFTSRLTVEIPGVSLDDVDNVRDFIAQAGLVVGGTGAKVRPLTSCKGTTCVYGNADTQRICAKLFDTFYTGWGSVTLPHKFKISVGGCPNNCVKPDLNDLGIIGQRIPQVDLEKCRGCKVCQVENTCPIHVAKVRDGKVLIDDSACNHCGRCVGKCPFKAVEAHQDGYRVYIGGRWGKKVAQGKYLDKVFTTKEEVLNVVEKAILLFREQGNTGERFADTVARLGFEDVQEKLLSNQLLERKQENLSAQKHMKGGATC